MDFKKCLFVCLITVLTASAASANVYVAWKASGGFFFNATPSVGILGDGTGNSTLAQLIWSTDNVRDAADLTTANYVTGDDVWLADFTITEDGVANDGSTFDSYAWFGSQTFNDGGAQSSGGYIYARVFQDNSIDDGDWYYAGDIVLADDLDPVGPPADTPQVYEINASGVAGDAIDASSGYSFQVVPEPGTMGLLALGLVTLGGAARRRRKAAVEA